MQEELVLDFVLIPAGEFVMGSDRKQDRSWQSDETPCHSLIISDYYIMRHPATNAQYDLFVRATGHRPPLFWPDGIFPQDKADHPVVGVSFQDAADFCIWATGVTGLQLRLPSEPEWEKAARGADGRIFPWGNLWNSGRTNSSEGKIGDTTPVGQFSPNGDSPYGIADMGGNVQEWISSLFGPYPYDPGDGRERLIYSLAALSLMPDTHDTGCTSVVNSLEASLDKSMLRGGSWRESKHQSRCAYRSWAAPMHRSDDTGFRCVYEIVS